jgi:hypothetical protein
MGQAITENEAMERYRRLFGVALLGCLLVGCGNEQVASTEGGSGAAGGNSTPEATVKEFMSAFKNGDDAAAEKLLSQKARQEAERTQKAVSPPGSKTMRYTVGQVEYVTEAKTAAHVACQIIDAEPSGEELTYDVVWFLRLEGEGWRVAGVAMKVFPDELPVLYNFEDQDDMDRKMQLVEEEMVRRAQQTIMQAQQPAADETRKQ